MAGVLSVKRYTITTSGGTGSTAMDGQTTANCVPFATRRITTRPTDANDWAGYCMKIGFSGGNVVATLTDTVSVVVVEVTVVEFDPASVTVNSGTFTISAGSDSSGAVSIGDTVDLTKTFMVHSWEVATDPDGSHEDNLVRGRITSTTELTFDRGELTAAPAIDGIWYTTESIAGDFTVEQAIWTVPANDATEAVTITSVGADRTKAFIIPSLKTAESSDNNEAFPYFELDSTTTVTATRVSTTDAALDCVAFVVKFAGNEKVQRGTYQDVTPAETPIDITLSPSVDLTLAMPHLCAPQSTRNGGYPGTNVDSQSDCCHTAELTSATNLRIQKVLLDDTIDGWVSWEVVEWELSAGGPSGRVMVR